jgi:hypothetical protein
MEKLKYILIIALSLSWFGCLGQNDTTENEQPILKIEVELLTNLDSISLPAYCGIFKWDMTFEYRIIKVINGNYDEKTILINHICPREAVENKWIENNKIYTYTVKKRFGFKSISVGEKMKKEELSDYEIIE